MHFLLTASLLLGGAGAGAAVRSFDVTASKFKFEPGTLEVVEGDRVVVTLRSTDTEHGFAIKKLKVKTAIPKGGAPITVEFVAPPPGTYEITCSEYCGSGHSRMKGKLVVTPRAGAAR